MTSLAEARVLFVAAAGPRRGLPHLVQYLLLARAHGMRPLVAVPGPRHEAETALALGADVIARATPAVIEAMQPDVLIVDDAVAAQTGSWIIAAQRVGALILDVNDLGAGSSDPGDDVEFVVRRALPGAVREGKPRATASQAARR
jgi:hypothetical protein